MTYERIEDGEIVTIKAREDNGICLGQATLDFCSRQWQLGGTSRVSAHQDGRKPYGGRGWKVRMEADAKADLARVIGGDF